MDEISLSPYNYIKKVYLDGEKIIANGTYTNAEFRGWLLHCNSAIGKVFNLENPIKKNLRNLLKEIKYFDKEKFLNVYQIVSIIYNSLERIESVEFNGKVNSLVQNKNVFVIHGHDELNLLKLKDMLRDDFQLNPILMQLKPGLNRYLLEKFEQEASTCSFSIALFTKDDLIEDKTGSKYFQARPNVLFEFGWFLSKLGKDKLLMILQDGVKLHSDYDGVSRVQFSDDIANAFKPIQNELRGLGVI
jgi:predicted nucleotide-binding protein